MRFLDMDIPKKSIIYGAIHTLANRLQTVGDTIDPTISSKQWFLLAIVSRFEGEPPNLSDVAEVLGTSRQNVKKMANILEKRGFMRLEKDPRDLRSMLLFLTVKCINYFKSREEQEMEYIEHIFSGMDDEMLDSLCKGLTMLTKNIDTLLEEKNAKKP